MGKGKSIEWLMKGSFITGGEDGYIRLFFFEDAYFKKVWESLEYNL